jgi:hypothetical protein
MLGAVYVAINSWFLPLETPAKYSSTSKPGLSLPQEKKNPDFMSEGQQSMVQVKMHALNPLIDSIFLV